jgi:hypothetical protein
MLRAAALLLFAAAASPAWAVDVSALEPAFGNTIVSTYPDGRTAKAWLNRDGTYRGTSRRGVAMAGRWSLKGDNVCFRQSRPFPAPVSWCTPVHQGGVGATWNAKAVTGEPIRLELAPGR